MAKVYYSRNPDLSSAAKDVLEKVINDENLELGNTLPLKVHFGEKGNETFINEDAYKGVLDYLKGKKLFYIETNVLYKGERTRRKDHIALARKHGFTLPIIIADGKCGESYYDVQINQKHFRSCKLGKEFSNYKQYIIFSHFKGHGLAGFGGAIKQLAMGFASRGGKLAQHLETKPKISGFRCKGCGKCRDACPTNAIKIDRKAKIDYDYCVGCAVCTSVCPYNAVSVISLKSILKVFGNPFYEKLAEYAYAAQLDKKNVYINFAVNITKGCDCVGKKMKPIVEDIGVFASTDAVAIDMACLDKIKEKGKGFRGLHTLKYAEKIGLGSTVYELVEL